jgi:seryl-tRNA synthetase
MLDIKFVRDHPELVQKNTDRRRVKANVTHLLKLDSSRKQLIQEVESCRAFRNEFTSGKPTPEQLSKLADNKEKLTKAEAALKAVDEEFTSYLVKFPNLLADEVPDGVGDDDHIEIAAWVPESGYMPKNKLGVGNSSGKHMPAKKGLHHVDLGKLLDVIDIDQSAKVSGSRFCYLKGDLVLLQYALFDFLKSKLVKDGFTPMVVPVLVKERVLFGTSHFPEGRDQVYEIKTDLVEDNNQLFLVGSSEPPLFAYWMDRVIDPAKLPAKMFALTHCFRSEVGSWGKDVRGIKRVHQFDKLEMDIVCAPQESNNILEYLRGINEWFMQQLELPYRIILKCAGDCGYNATHKQYDLEGWLPAQGEFIELGSNTNATDYQSRRLNIQINTPEGKVFAHTVNDTGIPMGRMLITIMDNYQNADGSVTIPKVLQPYMGKTAITAQTTV